MLSLVPADATTTDIIGFIWFFSAWGLFTLFQNHLMRGRSIINQELVAVRRAWMARMAERENRMIDAILVGHTMHSCTFFASTTILIIAGLVGALGAVDRLHDLLLSLAFSAKTSRGFLEAKMMMMIGIFAFGFFKFTWAIRQFNYALAVMGSVPLPPLSRVECRHYGANVADTLTMAIAAFNGGLRAYYFALAALCWFFDNRLFIVATVLIILVLINRQVRSRSAQIIRRHRQDLSTYDQRPERQDTAA